MKSFDEIMERTRRSAMKAKKNGSSKHRKQIDLGPGVPVNSSRQVKR